MSRNTVKDRISKMETNTAEQLTTVNTIELVEILSVKTSKHATQADIPAVICTKEFIQQSLVFYSKSDMR